MSNETQSTPGGLPPKLDLRSKLGPASQQPALTVKPFQGKKEPPPSGEEPVAEVQTMRKETMRIKLTDETVASSAAGPDPTGSEASAAPAPTPTPQPADPEQKPKLAPKLTPRPLATPTPPPSAPTPATPPTAPATGAAASAPKSSLPAGIRKLTLNPPTPAKPLSSVQPDAPGAKPASEPETTPPAPVAPQPVAPLAPKPLAPKTVRFKSTPLTPAAGGQFGATVPEAKKKETSKVPLVPPAGEDGPVGPKTIKVKPLSLNGTVKPGVPGVPGGPDESDPKRQTSRIPLEQALGDDKGTGPKTIRLKRPDDVSSVKITPPAADASTEKPEQDKGVPTKTTQLDDAALRNITGPTGPTPTQKRTIKVKRPQGGAGGSGIAVKRTSTPAAGTTSAGTSAGGSATAIMTGPAKDHAHWTFITAGIMTVIVLLCTIYLFSAQALGPNHGLTQLSSLIDGPDLSIPGNWKLPRGM